MKLVRLSLFLLLCVFAEKLMAQVTVSGALVGNGTYTNLTGFSGAFFGINSGAQTAANIIITIDADITETGSVPLISGVWTSITIKPSGGATRIISGVVNNPMIALNGADNVTFDGLNTGGNTLTIKNTSSLTSASAIYLYNDATNNIIQNCTILGDNSGNVSSSTDGAVIYFGAAGSGSGNDNNTIQNCNVGPATIFLPFTLIKSYGSASPKENSGNSISNNNLYDYTNNSNNVDCQAIGIYFGSTSWTISANKIYQTAQRDISSGAADNFYGIRIETGNNYSITNNIIGYSASNGTGVTKYTNPGYTSIEFYGMYLNFNSNTTASTISNNSVTAIDFSTARVSAIYPFVGIWINAGKATISNNTIGANSGIDNIIYSLNTSVSAPTFPIVGILNGGTASNTISNNIIGGITIKYTGLGAIGTYGGNPFSGIYNNNTGASTITGNTIGNSTANNITSANIISGANVTGIKLTSNVGSSNTISSNTIQNLNCSGANAGSAASASVVGISNTSCNGFSDVISGNVISNLTNTSASGNTDVRGMYVTGGSGVAGALDVKKNWIHSLSVASTSSTAQISGITIFGGVSSTLSNNMISLGSGISTGNVFYGINYTGSQLLGYYNSVRILGTATSGSGNSHAFYCATTSALTLKNNIFINERSNNPNTLTGVHYAIRFNSIPTAYTGVAKEFTKPFSLDNKAYMFSAAYSNYLFDAIGIENEKIEGIIYPSCLDKTTIRSLGLNYAFNNS
ncbi:MAG: hypothetical protein ABI729_06045, partial [Chitinophagales bacterium]